MIQDSNSTDHIDHEATVKTIDPARHIVTVALTDKGNCDGCAAASICHPGARRDGVAVYSRDAERYRPGQRVVVRGTERMHRRAIMLATVLPCICLVAVMFIVYLLTFSQGAAALSGLSAMTLFFVILYLARNRIAHEFTFTIVGDSD